MKESEERRNQENYREFIGIFHKLSPANQNLLIQQARRLEQRERNCGGGDERACCGQSTKTGGEKMEYKYDIISAGFSVVELPRKVKTTPFDVAGEFVGPFPSADTLILLDVAARLGRKCCWMGTVANNAFGRVIWNRLEQDGIETAYIKKLDSFCTPPVFVRYDEDGKREYLSDGRNSRTLKEEYISAQAVQSSRWVHFSGEVITALATGESRAAMLKMLGSIRPEQKVSLDPNDGYEGDVRDLMQPFIDRADLILPSEGEAKMLTGAASDEEACKMWAAEGKLVALKRGAKGCRIYDGARTIDVEAFRVEEVDQTGCGDSFCAGFITGLIEGRTLEQAGELANACGALQATVLGPMEGSKSKEEVLAFIQSQKEDRRKQNGY